VNKIEIYVDGDACPVKEEILRVATRHGLKIHIVSNSWMRLENSPLINQVVVSEGPDAADDWIVDRIAAGDIVITGDIPLARRVIESGAKAIGHSGKEFTEAGIGMAMAMRDLMSDLRAMGEVSGGGGAFSKRDRETFIRELERFIRE